MVSFPSVIFHIVHALMSVFFLVLTLNVSALPPHIEFARSTNWEKTPLGPIENWSGDLRMMVFSSCFIFLNDTMLTPYSPTWLWEVLTPLQCTGAPNT